MALHFPDEKGIIFLSKSNIYWCKMQHAIIQDHPTLTVLHLVKVIEIVHRLVTRKAQLMCLKSLRLSTFWHWMAGFLSMYNP